MDQYRFDKNMIKGRIAESLIEQLFERMGYEVYRYGMENTIPGIMKKLASSKPKEVINEIAKMPDFVVKYSNFIHFIEVKFRANGHFDFDDIGSYYPYKNAYFIVVSKRHIKCLSYSELEEGKKITPNSKNYLGNREDFKTRKDTIIQFCKFAVKFFESV